MARVPDGLCYLADDGEIKATLLLGSLSSGLLTIPLGLFVVPEDVRLPWPWPTPDMLPERWEAHKWHSQPEIQWTFADPPKSPKTILVALGTGAMLVPLALFALVVRLLSCCPSLTQSAQSERFAQMWRFRSLFGRPTGATVHFALTLIAFESFMVYFWTSKLQLVPMVPYFGLMAAALAWATRRVVVDMRHRRVLAESKAKKSS